MRALFVLLALLMSPAAQASDVRQLLGMYNRVQDEVVRGVAGAGDLRDQLHSTIAERIDAGDIAAIDTEALAQFALSGGRARKLRQAFDGDKTPLSVAITALLRGEPDAVRTALESLETSSLATRTQALVALNLALLTEGPTATRMLLKAAALAPGTIIEEAALRRIVLLSDSNAEPAALYWRRYPKSPYGGAIEGALLAKLTELPQAKADAFLDRLLAAMPRKVASAFAVAWTRRALLAARPDAARKALKAARAFDDAKNDMVRERDLLVARVSDLANADTDGVLRQLSRLDPARLRRQDRAVLAASKRIAKAILAPLSAEATAPFRWQDSDLATRLEAVDRLLDD